MLTKGFVLAKNQKWLNMKYFRLETFGKISHSAKQFLKGIIFLRSQSFDFNVSEHTGAPLGAK